MTDNSLVLCKNHFDDFFLPSLFSFRSIQASFPFQYEMKASPYYSIFYCKKGNGTIVFQGKEYPISPSIVLYFPPVLDIRLIAASSVWELDVLFIRGTGLERYYSYIENHNHFSYVMPIQSLLSDCFKKIFALASQEGDSVEYMRAKFLTDILTEPCTRSYETEATLSNIPEYIRKMKNILDERYREQLSLGLLEYELNLSKYRLCREFSRYYQVSPLQYLNSVRMEKAKNLLLTSFNTVHEIGSSVGIENTNHFITLFKRSTGSTPLSFRQNALHSLSLLHEPDHHN